MDVTNHTQTEDVCSLCQQAFCLFLHRILGEKKHLSLLKGVFFVEETGEAVIQ